MPDMNAEKSMNTSVREMNVRHQGRGGQVWIYLGKLLRMFIYQSDWKMLPMSALIAGLVGLVIRRKMFLNMEGTMMGSFAIVCVCIWNGCFNSIQAICRERDVIKREHRSGMHVSSYITSHMIYQAMICALQTVITLYVTRMTGVQYPKEGLFTEWMIVDLGISMMLITYASDMLSLWVSTIARSATTAMTIMPFILIFQLVFSGGMLSIPKWAEPLTNFTISNPGLCVIGAQADINNRPFVTITDMLQKMRGKEIEISMTPGQMVDMLENLDLGKYVEEVDWKKVIDDLRKSPDIVEHIDESIMFLQTTVGEVLDTVGEETLKAYLESSASEASYNPNYECTKENIIGYWGRLILFILVFSLLAVITLEFIDKDKR